MTTYVFRESGSAPIPAQVIGEELERIRLNADGRLIPADIVAAARPAKAPLHPCFVWDDTEAAKRWREHQARNLVRIVMTVEEAGPAPAFVHCRIESQPYYQSTAVAVKNTDEWASAVAGLAQKLRGAKVAFEDLMRVSSRRDAPPHAAAVATIGKALAAIDRALHTLES